MVPDIRLIAWANACWILRLLDVIRENLPEIAEGACEPRKSELKCLAASRERVTIAQLWPRLRTVATWIGGGCAIAAEKVRVDLPAGAKMVDAGYVASEVRGTIVVDIEKNLALPLLEDVFFEFAEVDAWNAGRRDTLLLHELVDECEYYVLVTTIAGLMRYHMNDVLRVKGRVGATPSLHFVRKGRGVTNITGEKLSEDQLQSAMAALSPTPHFFIALADAAASRYRIYAPLEIAPQLAAASIDAHLRQLNLEYDSKRASGRLLAPECVCTNASAADAYHRHLVDNKKQREAQVKVLSLQTSEEFDFDFGPYILPEASHATHR
jgi:hypothetical protein